MIWLRVAALTLLMVIPAHASIPPYYQRVGESLEIPAVLLYAIAIQESRPPVGVISGVDIPWPWTLNCAGRGFYFSNRTAAVRYARALISAGQNCDIGLMQISWRWHERRFASISDAFDPYTNIRTGAEILHEQYARTGTWASAVGAYHSPSNAARAERYMNNVKKHLLYLNGERD